MAPVAGTIYTGSPSDLKEFSSTLSNVKWSDWLGKRVFIDFNNAKKKETEFFPQFYHNPQGVISSSMLDTWGRNSVREILAHSLSRNHEIEIGLLQIVFKDGRIQNSTLIEGDEHSFGMTREIRDMKLGIDWANVAEFRIYHTHPSEVPTPLSITDKYLVKDRLDASIPQKIPVHIFAIAAHAQGEIIFVQSRLSKERQERLANTGFQFSNLDSKNPNSFFSDRNQESAQEIFGLGNHTIFGINKNGKFYLVIGQRRYEIDSNSRAKIQEQTNDFVDEGWLFLLDFNSIGKLDLKPTRLPYKYIRRMLNPNRAVQDLLLNLTGITSEITVKKDFPQQIRFSDSTGQPVSFKTMRYHQSNN